jgi:uncharacterized membrane protein
MKVVYVGLALLAALGWGMDANAQTGSQNQEINEVVRAEVLQVIDTFDREIAGTDAMATVQSLRVELLTGTREGDIVVFENEAVLLQVGDTFFLNYLITINGDEFFLYKDYDRRGPMVILALLFVTMMVAFGGWQGARALVSLALSAGAILFLLVPALLAGYNAALVSLVVAGVILALVLFGTHGFKPHVMIAFAGTWGAVLVTCGLAAWWVHTLRLSGFGAEASVYLNFATDGTLDFAGLLLGAIIIGILGVLDDVSITQASVVQELKAANQSFSIRELYTRAIRVGRDHVSSLVNTLALAYVGVALPLVLFLSTSQAPIGELINQEIVAAELTRIIIGSLGLILAVPFTTGLAAWWFGTRGVDPDAVVPSAPCGHAHHHH